MEIRSTSHNLSLGLIHPGRAQMALVLPEEPLRR